MSKLPDWVDAARSKFWSRLVFIPSILYLSACYYLHYELGYSIGKPAAYLAVVAMLGVVAGWIGHDCGD